MRLAISDYTATSAAGTGLADLRASLAARSSGLRRNDFDGCDLETWIGRVGCVEKVELPAHLAELQSRNNQLAWLGLIQDGLLDAVMALSDQISTHQIGVVMGTSTSSIGGTKKPIRNLAARQRLRPELRQPGVHHLHSPGMLHYDGLERTGNHNQHRVLVKRQGICDGVPMDSAWHGRCCFSRWCRQPLLKSSLWLQLAGTDLS